MEKLNKAQQQIKANYAQAVHVMNYHKNGTYRPESPVLDNKYTAVYGWIDHKPIHNPDFRWPADMQQECDAWIEDDMICTK